MAQPTPRIGGRPWRRLCARLRTNPAYHTCWRCGQPIDLHLRFPHPMSWSGDHVIALYHGGRELDPANVRAAHLTHNSSAGATIKTTDQPEPTTIDLPAKDETYDLWTNQG